MTISSNTTAGVTLRVIALTVLLSASLEAQNGAETAYDRVAKAWSGTKSLEANFDQKITNPLLGRTVTSRGVFQQQRPGKVSITFTQPAGDRIVGDGKTLWVYLPSSAPGQVLKLPGDADGAIVADLLGQLLETPKRAFVISGGEAVSIDGRATRRVQLLPRNPDAVPFQKATLWLDDQEPRPVRVQVIDGQGVDRTITLTSWSPDAPLPKNAFDFKVPKGAKVQTKLPGA
jgi:outer membrane lipoprotein carrier protein